MLRLGKVRTEGFLEEGCRAEPLRVGSVWIGREEDQCEDQCE